MSGEGFPSELLHSHKSCRSACQDRGFLLSSEKIQADSGGVFRRLRQNVVCVACTKVWRGCRYLRGSGNCGTPGVRRVPLVRRRGDSKEEPGWAELSSCTPGGKNAGAGVAEPGVGMGQRKLCRMGILQVTAQE